MHRYRVVLGPAPRVLSVVAACVLLVALSSCGFGRPTGSRHLVIATLFAGSGTRATTNLPAQYGVELAVSHAHLPDGYTLGVESKDEAYGSTGYYPAIDTVTTEARNLASNAQVVGVVGP